MKNTTIKDISKYTGFSTMTVSRVINDKVNRAIKKYGYEPNELARRLDEPPDDYHGGVPCGPLCTGGSTFFTPPTSPVRTSV